jgi:Leucine-rich repeat (LRR) protein
MICVIEGLSMLVKLKTLNLSFNKITKIEGLANLLMLEILELGKNYISDCDALAMCKFAHLQELYLYMNQIRTLPRLSYPMLRIFNINRNQDLSEIKVGYCPMLESIMASYCSLKTIGDYSSCQNL